ncbi:glycosyltransferase family 2 protein [Lepagella muris]|jgi:glycosyltransferase involved in cell wall biosynthesis|uniref:Glycosyltransferase family 2 protein n=1 Tax=Lepagella muris TaxID=3032870 RepID=A0AC61RGD0_9BACT|nr:glycosyltransferase family 2 protein [Lepagella muris]ROT06911.1 glycosyltransferase family 2 protein [Muribaculaceae bacterium Isolate-037 (Harlan)]TGY79597.1 glycosyltransferase family 2 protein [Lepagella muris]THG53067.1 glycosyltransferase family 2 protein [Bacteroidales bacterium]TKC61987.1 glycosyltransferase family 2 protein [Bacteroidales bacterium]
MKKILSIIIPSYNMEKYLPQCIDSLLVEKIDSLDILIINDGSKDRTLEIGRRYETKYPQSIRVIDKSNGNYGSCINRGLKEAVGKYIKVLDADDSFEKSNLDEFIDYLSKVDVDLVVSDYDIVNESGITTKKNRFSLKNDLTIFLFKDVLLRISIPEFQMHSVTYNRNVFRNIAYVQTEGVSYTDMEWMFLPMTKVETVSFYGKVIYKYLIGREGQTVNTSVSQKAVGQTMFVVKHLLQIYSEHKDKISLYHKEYLEYRLREKTPSLYRICLIKIGDTVQYANLKEFDGILANQFPELYQLMENETVKAIPFHYIRYWRQKDYSDNIFLLRVIHKLVKLLKS